MDSIFGLLSLVLLLAICAGAVFSVIFLARKLGFIAEAAQDESAKGIGGVSHRGINLGESKAIRYGLVGVLVALLTIPLATVNDLVAERHGLYADVQNEIAQTWGQSQTVRGPLLVVPYTGKFNVEEVVTDKDGNETKKTKTIHKYRKAIILPDELSIDASLNELEKNRGIYSSLVYQADLAVVGSFDLPDLKKLSKHIDQIHWEHAWLTIGLSDTQAINKVSALKWGVDNQRFNFEPGAKVTSLIKSGFHAPLVKNSVVALSEQSKDTIPFSLTLNINGSGSIGFSPFGQTTKASIKSDWPHPSFVGDFLPANHDISAQGFAAQWSIPHLARSYPQYWTLGQDEHSVDAYSAGVKIFEPISLYSKVTRAVKYGLLFILLTYATFLIFELGVGRGLHIVQYGVVGFALTLFYLILLSMSEHAGFLKAYLVAASVIVSMIGVYVFMALRSPTKAGAITGMLSGLYLLLYVMLRLEDYALMVGVGLLVCTLAVIMYFTRNLGTQRKAT